MLELVSRSVHNSIYSMPSKLALMYDELDRRKELFFGHADFAEILLLEHECDDMMQGYVAKGLIYRFDEGQAERVKSWPKLFSPRCSPLRI